MSAHLAIDVRERWLYWARARSSRDGLVPTECGRQERLPTVDLATQLRDLAAGVGKRTRIEVSLHAQTLIHRREELPKLRRAESAGIAARRGSELLAEVGEEGCLSFTRSERGDGPMWLCATPLEVAREAVERWRNAGFEIDRLSSRHLSLGNVAKLLRPADGELVTILDLESEFGTCVVADRHGWVFSREVPLRFMGDRRLVTSGQESPTVAQHDGSAALETSGLELDDEKQSEAADLDPFEAIAEQTERLATELKRTFRYVEGQLGLGSVSSVHLTGEGSMLGELAKSLGATLRIPVSLLGDGIDDPRFKDLATPASVALGLALAPTRDDGNLLPPPELRTKAAARARHQLQTALAMSLASVVAACVLLGLHAHSASEKHAALEAQWDAGARRRELVERVDLARARSLTLAEAVARIDAPQPSWVALLAALARFAPDDGFVEQFQADREDGLWTITLAVEAGGDTVAEAAQAVARFTQEASAWPLLAVDATKRESVMQVGGQAGERARVRFRMEGRLVPTQIRSVGEPAPAPEGEARG